MALQTDLSRSPYYDNFDEAKNFYRVLYRPSVAVQTRELNQMQTILQDQIDKFGRHIFKEGSVVEGCSFTFDPNYHYVKINDNYANSSAFTISDFLDNYIYNSNGLRALIVDSVAGFESQAPDLNTLYIKYLATASYPNGSPQSTYANGEILQVKTSANIAIGNVTVATVTNSVGKGYAFTTTSGVIFQKGFFVTVNPQTILVSKYINEPDDVSVGFTTEESIVTPEADTSLLDNSAGSPNYAAPGAHRLQLTPTLITRTTSTLSNNTPFFSMCDFKFGKPVSIKNDPQYAVLGKDMARRTYETNGNYVVYPFILTTESKETTTGSITPNSHVNLYSSRGTGYVEGFRVEILNNTKVDLRKGNDYETLSGQIISANYGHYIEIKEFCGEINTDTLLRLQLHNTAYNAISGETRLSTSYTSGNVIGYAYARGFLYDSGAIGSDSAVYRLYLFDIEMVAGQKFSSVRSIMSYQSSVVKAVGDVVLTFGTTLAANGTLVGSNSAIIQQPVFNNMIFPLGQKALKPDGFSATQFVYRNRSAASFDTVLSGSMDVSIPSPVVGTGSEGFNQTGTLVGSSTDRFIVVPTTIGRTTNKSGTVAATSGQTNVVGSSTSFLTNYMENDYIIINGESKRIAYIANQTFLQVSTAFSTSPAANVHYKSFPVGVPIDFSKGNGTVDRQISIVGSTATFTLDEEISTSFSASIFYDVLRSSTTSAKKSISRNVYVAINCASHSAGSNGPWSLGFPDVLKINAIYVNSGTYSNTGVDFSSSFKLNNGQKDNYYDLSSISGAANILDSTSRIVIDLDVLRANQSQGVGFFDANSYPIDANTANTNAITIQQIPIYTATDGSSFDLRDSIDFRPFAANTASAAANSTNWTSTATVNPSSTLTFSVLASGTYLPSPDTNYESTVQHFLGRKDKAIIRINGEFAIIEGDASNRPLAPLDQQGAMTLGIINVPPYPSLPSRAAKTFNRYDYAISTNITQNKRYTMKDINTLSNRIDNLEYYTSLSLLEKQAKDTLVRSTTTGQNRFQNGILVDPFAGHDIGNVQDPTYNIAIDPTTTEMRPKFYQFRRPVNYNAAASSGTTKAFKNIYLNYTDSAYITQPYASKYRNCIEGNIFVWKGSVTFDPPGDTHADLTQAPDVVTNIDLASNWTTLGSSAFGTQWGNWTTVNKTDAKSESVTGTSSSTDVYGNISNTTKKQIATTTTELQQRAGNKMNVSVSENSYNLGTYVTDVSILPYVKAIQTYLIVKGLKPNTRVYGFMNNVDVNAYIRQTGSSFTIGSTKEFGEPLISDSTGSLYAIYTIPPNTFKATTLEMKFVDVSNLTAGESAISTTASGTFFASNISIAKGSSILNAREAVLSVSEVTDTQTINSAVIVNISDTTVIPAPPIVYPWYPPGPDPDYPNYSEGGGGSCCFDPNAKVLMESGAWKKISDVEVGDRVIGINNTVNTVVGTNNTTVADRKMIKIDGYDFYCTDDHLFLTNNGWKTWRPDRLIDNNRENSIFLEGENRHHPINANDYLITTNEKIYYPELNVKEVDFDPEYIVYDLHLDGNQTYVVEGFIVHNCGGGGCGCGSNDGSSGCDNSASSGDCSSDAGSDGGE